MPTITIKLPDDIIRQIDAEAAKTNTTRAQQTADLVVAGLGRDEAASRSAAEVARVQEALRGLYKNYQKWTKVRIEQAAWMQEAQKQAQEQAVQINQLQMALKAAEGKGEQKRVAAEPSAPVREEPRSEGGFFRRLFGGSKA